MENKYVKASLGYTIGNYLLRGISFLTLPLFVRLMTTSDYGNFNTYVAYESIFSIIVGLALHASLKNAKYKYTEEHAFEEYLSSCVQIGVVSTIVLLLIANVTYQLYSSILDMSRGIFNLMLIESYAASLVTLYTSYISLEYKFKNFLFVSFLNVIGNVLLSIILMFTILDTDRYLARVIGTAIPVMVIGAAIAIYFVKLGGLKFNKEFWKFGISFSSPLILHGVSQVILNQFDRIMIKIMTGAENAGVYSFSYNISSLVVVASNSLQQVWQPWFYEQMSVSNIESIRKRGDQFAYGMMIFVAMVMLGAREIILILGTEDYLNGIYYLIPILVGGYFAFLYNLPAQVEYYYEKTKYIALGTCIVAALNVLMNYVGVKLFGAIAAAYTTLIIYGIYFCIHCILSIKIHGSSMFNLKKIGIYTLCLLLIGAFALVFNSIWYIRWILMTIIGIYFLFWLNRAFEFINAFKSNISK